MQNKERVSVRLDAMHLRLLGELEPLYGNSMSEVARFLLVESLEAKHGLERLRQKKAIK